MKPGILAVNAGSATLKFSVFDPSGSMHLIDGLIDHFGQHGQTLRLRSTTGAPLTSTTVTGDGKQDAIACMLDSLGQHALKIVAVVHRVVHGGSDYHEPTLISPAVRQRLQELIFLAPLHLPPCLAVIDALNQQQADLLQIACFDTAFHVSQPPLAQRFAIARHWHDKGIRRYGFHGLSFASITRQLPALGLENSRVVVCHLGGGASACAINNSQSIAASTGFSALDGLMMASRPGNIDPEVLLYWMDHEKMSATDIRQELYLHSGLLGVSGISSDLRQLEASPAAEAAEAIALFCYRTVREIGALAAQMQGIDALIFTAGIGEHSATVRQQILSSLAWLGFQLDPAANQAQTCRLTCADSLRHAYRLETDEEGEMARSAAALLSTPG